EHFQKTDQLQRQVDNLRKEMMDQLLEKEPDAAQTEKKALQLGQKMAEHEKAVFYHFQELMEVCDAEQKIKYRLLLRQILDQLAPPGHGPPGGGQPPPHNRGERAQHPPPRRGPAQGERPSPPARSHSEEDRQRPPARKPGQEDRQRQPAHSPQQQAYTRDPQSSLPSPGDGRVERHIRRLQHGLGLTDSQSEKIRSIIETTFEKLEKIHSDSRYRGHDQRREAAEKIFQWEENQIEALLTDQQKQRYRQMEKRKGGPEGPPQR
ncbi:MAG: hypothetical protein GY940_29315, partial [bacterium]|nr:hypothetical protein [bacterium]